MKTILFPAVLGFIMFSAISAHAATPDWKQQLARASDEYFDQVYFRNAPSAGTQTGFHRAFSLEKFHDDFLRQGFPPIKIVREAMLGDNSPAL